MKITNGECFIIENALQNAAKDLRESDVKSLTFNFFVSRNLKKVSDVCQDLRKEINEFMPEKLREFNEKKEELNEEELKEKELLLKDYNLEVNKFLTEEIEVEFYKQKISMTTLEGVKLNFDSTNILALILDND